MRFMTLTHAQRAGRTRPALRRKADGDRWPLRRSQGGHRRLCSLSGESSKQEAIEQTVRFMELHKKHWPGWEGETEIRQVFDATDFHPGAANP